MVFSHFLVIAEKSTFNIILSDISYVTLTHVVSTPSFLARIATGHLRIFSTYNSPKLHDQKAKKTGQRFLTQRIQTQKFNIKRKASWVDLLNGLEVQEESSKIMKLTPLIPKFSSVFE